MRVSDIIANLPLGERGPADDFFGDYLGLRTEMDQGWVVRYTSPDSGAHLQVVARDATAAEDSVATIRVDDVDAAYDEARRRGYEIVHPLVTEPWGVRRFFVRSPDGPVVNIAASH